MAKHNYDVITHIILRMRRKAENASKQDISAADMSLNLQNLSQEYTLVDVSQPDEYALDHIPGTVNIPRGDNRT